MNTTPTVVKAKGPAQLLAAVPGLIGFTPVNSLVLIMFNGRRTLGAARVDLSQFRAEPHTTVLEVVGRAALTMPPGAKLDGVVPVIYLPAGEDPAARDMEHIALIEDVFKAMLIEMLGGFVVGENFVSDEWGVTFPTMEIALAVTDMPYAVNARGARTVEAAREAGDGLITV